MAAFLTIPLVREGTSASEGYALPLESRTRTLEQVATDFARELLEKWPSTAAVVFCVHTEEPVCRDRPKPFAEVQSAMGAAFRHAGIPVVESLYFADNGWGSYLCRNPYQQCFGPIPHGESDTELRMIAEEIARRGELLK